MRVRPIVLCGKVGYVTLTRGYVSIIDADDADLVGLYNWQVKLDKRPCGSIRNAYAVRSVVSGDKRVKQFLHSLILKTLKGYETDHINGNGLDNRKQNLRQATSSQNKCNRGLGINNSSGYKGVSRHKATGKWQSQISYEGKSLFLGLFDDKESAAGCYKEHSERLFGHYKRIEEN